MGGSGWDDLLGYSINTIRGWVDADLQALVKYLREGGAEGTSMEDDTQGGLEDLARKVGFCVVVCLCSDCLTSGYFSVCFLCVLGRYGAVKRHMCVCIHVHLCMYTRTCTYKLAHQIQTCMHTHMA
jgi:hypothetical protein